MVRALLLTASFVASVSACGYANPGSGSGTLLVTANLVYNANGSDDTLASVPVQLNGLQMQNANIILTDGATGQAFTLAASGTNTLAGYHRDVQLYVRSNSDNLTCFSEGPGPFTITNPLQTQIHSIQQDLQIQWQTQDGVRANSVDITLANSGVRNTLADDSGNFTIQAGLLRAGTETVTVVRHTTMTPAGGAPGSYVEASYGVSVQFKIQ